MGMTENFQEILKVLRFDETLLRLLYYKPKDIKSGTKDPLDPSLPNILDIDEDWTIRDKVIIPMYKLDDLEGEAICRIHVYAGRRKPKANNYKLAIQDVIIDVLTHESFEKDYRSLRISDRLNELLINNRITGITKMSYGEGAKISVPDKYTGYRHFYSFESVKKDEFR